MPKHTGETKTDKVAMLQTVEIDQGVAVRLGFESPEQVVDSLSHVTDLAGTMDTLRALRDAPESNGAADVRKVNVLAGQILAQFQGVVSLTMPQHDKILAFNRSRRTKKRAA